MPDCISNASSLVITLSWFSLALMILGLLFGVKQQFSRKKRFPLLLLSFTHPVLWARGQSVCETPLWKSSLIFTVLAILVFSWSYFREKTAANFEISEK